MGLLVNDKPLAGIEVSMFIIRSRIQDLIDMADAMGVVFEVRLEPTQPFKMGGYKPVIETRVKRTPA